MMAQWYVKDLSKLTGVSVRTLHYYDQVSLLKPSIRQENGYRLYSERDLLKLQQIVALKYFGFELSQIQKFLSSKADVIDHFSMQSQFLEEKARTLLEASQALKDILSECTDSQLIPWEKILELIEVYKMTQKLEKSWAGKVFSPEQLKDYAAFEQSLKQYTQEEKDAYEQAWANLISEIGSNLDQDPTSTLGIDMGRRCMEMVNRLYGKQWVHLRKTIWEKGFKQGQMDAEHSLSPEVVQWLGKSIGAYYGKRSHEILNSENETAFINLWKELMEDMHGYEEEPKQALYHSMLHDSKVSSNAKEWLKKHFIK